LELAVGTTKQPRALQTREKILGAAAQLFALKGYHDAKLDEVQQTAQVTTGAFFHHFASKEALGLAVLAWHMERRRQELDQLEQKMPSPRSDDPLGRVFRRLDAIAQMIERREHRKGGCIIGNLSTALSDTHDGFRRRLAECFDEMAMEFQAHLEAAAKLHGAARRVDTKALARYIVAVIEGSIMLGRTQRDMRGMASNFENLKDYLKKILAT
jgi:TetR/AcrR family transcriptional repressor of nem operon